MGMCDCTPGDSRWKTRLRSAFDRLAAEIDRIYLEFALPYIHDPWHLRNQYIHVMLGQVTVGELIDEAAGRHLPDEIQLKIHAAARSAACPAAYVHLLRVVLR